MPQVSKVYFVGLVDEEMLGISGAASLSKCQYQTGTVLLRQESLTLQKWGHRSEPNTSQDFETLRL